MRLPEMLDEQIGQNPDFPHGVLARRPNDIYTTRCNRKLRHNRKQRVGRIRFDQKVRQFCDAESSNDCGCQSNRAVRFEPALGADRDHPGTVHQPPGFGTLQQGFVNQKLVGRFRSSMSADIVRAGDELGTHRCDPAGHQVRIREVPNSNSAIETLCLNIDEAVTVRGLYFKTRVPARELCEHGRKVCRAQGKRCSNPQATAQFPHRQDRLERDVHFATDPARMLPEGQTGLCEAGASRRTRQELDAKRLFQPEDAATDDGLGDAKPPRGRRQSAGISNLNESSQVLELQL